MCVFSLFFGSNRWSVLNNRINEEFFLVKFENKGSYGRESLSRR
jgi:hypothetical protein